MVWKGGGSAWLRLDFNGSKHIVWATVNNNPVQSPLTLLILPLTLQQHICDSLYPSLIPADPALTMAVSLKHKL